MKRIITVLLALIVLMCMMMPCSASTDTTLPISFKVPGKPVARETGCYTTLFFFVKSDVHHFRDLCFYNAETLGISGLHIYNQVDWKLNDGQWHYTED